MTIPTVTYPLDLTGINPDNLIRNEKHPIVPKKVVAVAPIHGAFYVESMQVSDSATGRLLTAGRDYFTAELHVIPTSQSRKDVCSLVILTDSKIGNNVTLTYQAVSGQYSDSDDSLAAMLNSIDFDTRNPAWPLPIIKSQDVSDAVRREGKGTVYSFEYAVQAINRIHAQLVQGNAQARDGVYSYLQAQVGQVTPDLVDRVRYAMLSAMGQHKKATNPHPMYFRRGDVIDYPKVRKPINKLPANNAAEVSLTPTLTADAYGAVYRVPHAESEFEWSKKSNMTDLLGKVLVGPVLSYKIDTQLEPNVRYYWRVRFKNVDNVWSAWSEVSSFSTSAGSVNQPSITSPANGAVNQERNLTITSSAFSVTGGTDTHESSDWEVWSTVNGAAVMVASSFNNTSAKTSLVLSVGALQYNTTYQARVRHNSALKGPSLWSNPINFTIKQAPPAAGTVLNTKCEGYNKYNLVADGNGGSNWMLAESNSSSCGYNPPAEGTVLKTYCDGYDKYETHADGNYGSYNVLVERNSSYCGYVAPPASGTLLSTYCSGTTRMGRYADGLGGTYDSVIENNSTQCGYVPPPVAGTELNRYCSGTTLMGTYADGSGGTYSAAIENNSTQCGYVPPPNHPPAGQEVNRYCSGTTLMGVYTNGSGGTYEQAIENNSTQCGYVPPPAAGTELSTYCSGTTLMRRVADGNGGSTDQVKEPNSPQCGYVDPGSDPTNPFPWLSEAHATSSDSSSNCQLMFGSGGDVSVSSSPQGTQESGNWRSHGDAANYELLYTVSGQTSNFSASSSPGTWYNLASDWFAYISESNGRASTKQVNISITVRNKISGASMSMSLNMLASTHTYEM